MLDHSADAAAIVARGRAAYDADHLLRLAAEAVLIHLGEAAHRVGPALLADHPDLGLREALGNRHVIAHGDDIVDHAMVWETLVQDVPRLASGVRALVE